MSKRVIPKEQLDRCIELTRKYHDPECPYDRDLMDEKRDACLDLERSTARCIYTFSDLLSSIFTYTGLNRDATNEDIYKVLEVLGWTVE